MAMFPNAARGYMPYVQGKQQVVKHKRSKIGAKYPKSENKQLNGQKMYQVTLRDKKGKTYKYIVRTDGSNSLPDLNTAKMNALHVASSSLPNLGVPSPPQNRRALIAKSDSEVNKESYSSLTTSLDLRECGKKEGLISSFIRFLKQKTGGKKEKSGKSKRKPKDVSQRKRQRTVSAMSNLDPIQESPNEHEYEGDEDVDSYTHDSCSLSSDSDSDSSSVDSTSIQDNEDNVTEKS